MHPLEQKLAAAWPPDQWQDLGIVVAVSGGADSVGLLRAVAALKKAGCGALHVAHFNHRQRGDASDADELFVTELSRAVEIPLTVGHAAVAPGGDPKKVPEEKSRAARYEFLRRTAEERGARYVVTAHTANDQAETVLHRIVRGTGLDGLRGIRRVRPLSTAVTLIRPMLEVRRAEIVQYLNELKQPYRQDESNSDVAYTRNRIRHDLIERLERDYNPAVIEALIRLSRLAAEAQEVIDGEVSSLLSSAVDVLPGGILNVDCRALDGVASYLVRQLFVELWRMHNWPLQAMGFAEWDALAQMTMAADSKSQKKHMPGGIVAERQDDILTLSSTSRPGD